MGRVKDFIARQFFGVTVAPTELAVKNIYSAVSGASTVVDEKTSLSSSVVYACVKNISETIATLPIRVYNNSSGSPIADSKHPINFLVSNRPSENLGKIDFIQTLLTYTLLWGNGYARITKNNARVTSLDLKHPGLVDVFILNGVLWYELFKIEANTKTREALVRADEMIHIQGVSVNGVYGISPIRAHSETIGIGMAATQFGGNFFKNGANMSGMLQHPRNLSQDAIDRLKVQFNEQYAGINASQKTMILEEGMIYNRISIPPNDAQMIETRKYSVEDVARIFRVQLNKVQSQEQTSYNSIEQENINWTTDTLRPWIKKIEEEFTYKLFRKSEQGTYTIEINLNALLRGDTKARAEFYTKLFAMGSLSANEIRAMEGMLPIDGGTADDYFVPMNLENQTNPQKNIEDGNE